MLRRFVMIMFLLMPLVAAAEDFIAGKDYEVINGTVTVNANNAKVSVIEFFSYGCPWCFRIESSLMNWVKQQEDTIQFSRVPVVFNKDWAYYAKAYYAAHLLDLENKLNPLLFKAIQDKQKSLNSNQAMVDFFIAQGVDPATANSAFVNSTTIDLQISAGTSLMARYHINGVPAIVVNNQFKTDLQMAHGEARMLKILNFLMAKSKAMQPTG